MKSIYIFGNPDVPIDSLPLRILPRLRICFPDLEFEIKDPNEDWEVPDELIIIDTALGLKEVTVFTDLDRFTPAPRVSLHDFDALANLRYLWKLGRLKNIKIIALPPDLEEERAVETVVEAVRGM